MLKNKLPQLHFFSNWLLEQVGLRLFFYNYIYKPFLQRSSTFSSICLFTCFWTDANWSSKNIEQIHLLWPVTSIPASIHLNTTEGERLSDKEDMRSAEDTMSAIWPYHNYKKDTDTCGELCCPVSVRNWQRAWESACMLLLVIVNGHVDSACICACVYAERERVCSKGFRAPLLQHIWALYQDFN